MSRTATPLAARRPRGRLRDELLNSWHFDSLLEARVIIEDWRCDYNANKPNLPSTLTPVDLQPGYRPPGPPNGSPSAPPEKIGRRPLLSTGHAGTADRVGIPDARAGQPPEPGFLDEMMDNLAFKSAMRSAGTVLGREITRSIFGTGRRKRRR